MDIIHAVRSNLLKFVDEAPRHFEPLLSHWLLGVGERRADRRQYLHPRLRQSVEALRRGQGVDARYSTRRKRVA